MQVTAANNSKQQEPAANSLLPTDEKCLSIGFQTFRPLLGADFDTCWVRNYMVFWSFGSSTT